MKTSEKLQARFREVRELKKQMLVDALEARSKIDAFIEQQENELKEKQESIDTLHQQVWAEAYEELGIDSELSWQYDPLTGEVTEKQENKEGFKEFLKDMIRSM